MIKDMVVNLVGRGPQDFAADYALSVAATFGAHHIVRDAEYLTWRYADSPRPYARAVTAEPGPGTREGDFDRTRLAAVP